MYLTDEFRPLDIRRTKYGFCLHIQIRYLRIVVGRYLRSRSGSSSILERMATTLLPPCAFNSVWVRVAPRVAMSPSET